MRRRERETRISHTMQKYRRRCPQGIEKYGRTVVTTGDRGYRPVNRYVTPATAAVTTHTAMAQVTIVVLVVVFVVVRHGAAASAATAR